MVRGRMVYCPAVVFKQLNAIKRMEGLHSRQEAFRKLTSYAELGIKVKKNDKLYRGLI